MGKAMGLLILIALILISLIGMVSAATNVYVAPNLASLQAGNNITINISLDTNESVYAASFDLIFNPNIVKGLNSADGGFLGKDGASVLVAVNSIDNNLGRFSFAATRSVVQTGVSGVGNIAVITFNASSLGSSVLEITNIQIVKLVPPNILQPVIINSIINGSINVVVANTAPVASNLQLSPLQPYTTDNLIASYIYYDADGNPEQGSEIRWYKNNVLQSSYNDLTNVPSSATAKSQAWYFTVKPKDGTAFGTLQTSNTVNIRNSKPVLSLIGNKTINENQLLNFTINAADSDSDSLIYSATNIPLNASFNSATKTFTWMPNYSQAGIYYVTFNVTDSSDSDFEIVKIEVNNVNQNPAITFFSPSNLTLKFREGLQLLFRQISSDADNEPLSYKWYLDSLEKATTQNWTIAFDTTQCGLRTITLNVSDNNLTASKTWKVTVNLKGDINLDKKVDIVDLASIGLAYRNKPGDANWNSNADINPSPGQNGELEGNNLIDIYDLASVGLAYNRIC